jgi:hypothetical protein
MKTTKTPLHTTLFFLLKLKGNFVFKLFQKNKKTQAPRAWYNARPKTPLSLANMQDPSEFITVYNFTFQIKFIIFFYNVIIFFFKFIIINNNNNNF